MITEAHLHLRQKIRSEVRAARAYQIHAVRCTIHCRHTNREDHIPPGKNRQDENTSQLDVEKSNSNSKKITKASSARRRPQEVARVSLRLNSKWRAMATSVIPFVKYRLSGGSSSAGRKRTTRENRSCFEQTRVSGFLVVVMNLLFKNQLLWYVR